jgi:hypothetical protein
MTLEGYLSLVLPFLAGLAVGSVLRRPLEGVLVVVLVGVGVWGYLHPEAFRAWVDELIREGTSWLRYGVEQGVFWLGEALRTNPVVLAQSLEAWARGLEPEKLFLLGVIGGLRA